MNKCHWIVAIPVAIALSVGGSAIRSMEPAPPQYKGQPLQTVVANNGHVYALYGTRPYGREWLPLTTDTVPRLNLKSGNGLLSPGRDRYFYVSVEPNFDGLHRIIAPNFDFELENVTPVNHLYGPSQNDVVMYLHVHRLSGEQVTAVPLQRPYWGEYETGGWVGNRWISLHERRGKFGGNRYSLFVNVETGEKRLVGLVVNDENSTSDSGHLTFTHKGAFFLDFRPVYPSFEEPLPDFGDEQGWKAYYEKHLLRKEKRPWERRGEHYITEYALTPDGKKAILLDHRDWAEKKITSFTELPDDKTTPLASVLSPELVFIDLDKIETTKDPKRYSATTLLPKESRAYLQRDDGAGEIRVGGSEKVLWRKSFAEIAAP